MARMSETPTAFVPRHSVVTAHSFSLSTSVCLSPLLSGKGYAIAALLLLHNIIISTTCNHYWLPIMKQLNSRKKLKNHPFYYQNKYQIDGVIQGYGFSARGGSGSSLSVPSSSAYHVVSVHTTTTTSSRSSNTTNFSHSNKSINMSAKFDMTRKPHYHILICIKQHQPSIPPTTTSNEICICESEYISLSAWSLTSHPLHITYNSITISLECISSSLSLTRSVFVSFIPTRNIEKLVPSIVSIVHCHHSQRNSVVVSIFVIGISHIRVFDMTVCTHTKVSKHTTSSASSHHTHTHTRIQHYICFMLLCRTVTMSCLFPTTNPEIISICASSASNTRRVFI